MFVIVQAKVKEKIFDVCHYSS